MSRVMARYRDPDGERHGGLPTYPWRGAPDGLATRRQLRAAGLSPGGQDVAAQVRWMRYGQERTAYLYPVSGARPKRTATPAVRAAVDRAIAARRVCGTCGQDRGYCIPRRFGECLDCAERSGQIPHSRTEAAA